MDNARRRLIRFMTRLAAVTSTNRPIPKVFPRRVPTLWRQLVYLPRRWIVQRGYKSYTALNNITDLARRKRDDPVIRVVCISDTHNSHHRLPPLPEGDILIHAGDLTNTGSAPELHNALLWLDGQPHPHKVFIAGNHDAALAESSARDYVRANFPNLIYLQDESVRLKLRDRWHVRVHGTPHTPGRGERGVFQYERGGGYPKVRAIPIRTDILVTHGPPQFHLDAAGAGCNSLRSELWRVRPLLHVFGHIHAGRGVEYTRWSSVTTWYEGVCKGRVGFGWKAALRVVLAALQKAVGIDADSRLVNRHAQCESILVNASSVGGIWSSKLLEPIVVELALLSPGEKARRRKALRLKSERKAAR